MSHVYLLHENEEWVAPLRASLAELGLSCREWFLDLGHVDLDEEPPVGIFYSRMSASSHTRGHRHAVDHAACVLRWLESHRRRVINGSHALQLEVSKVAQHNALKAHGIRTPHTVAALGRAAIVEGARAFAGPFITKHNRGGKGLGVRLFQNVDELRDYVEGDDFDPPIDGVTIVQEYIEAPEPFITRVEFIGKQCLYAVRVDTSHGFELCPADACNIDDSPIGREIGERFVIQPTFDHALHDSYCEFLQRHDIEVAAFEFVVDRDGSAYTYDININTNYNTEAEARAGVSGMHRLAHYLGAELNKLGAP